MEVWVEMCSERGVHRGSLKLSANKQEQNQNHESGRRGGGGGGSGALAEDAIDRCMFSVHACIITCMS